MMPGEGTDGRSVRSRRRWGVRVATVLTKRPEDRQPFREKLWCRPPCDRHHRVIDTQVRRVRATQLSAYRQFDFQIACSDSESGAGCQNIFLDKHFLAGNLDPIEATAGDYQFPIGIGVGWCQVPDSTDSELRAGWAGIRGNGIPCAGRIGLGGSVMADVE